MQKNEFEKQVRQKMEELKLHPSDSIWLNIEAHISKKKRRRLAWVFFPILLTCLCGGYWLINSVNKSKPEQGNKLSEGFIKKDSSTKIQTTHQSAKGIAVLNQTKKILPQSFEKRSAKRSSSKQGNIETVFTQLVPRKKTSNNIPPNLKSNIVEPLAILDQGKNLTSKDREDLKKEESKIISEKINEIDNAGSNINTDSSLTKVITDSVNQDKETKKVTVLSKQAKTRKPYKTKSAWKWGLNFSAGISGVPNKFLGSLDKSFARADAYSSSSPQNNFAPLPSKIKSSGGVIAGFFIEKNISKKKMVTAGINYKMFSAINKVGEINDSSQQYSLSNAVNNYHHYYHFIELPVSLKVQISSKNIPLFWDGGVSISQLISSNALQFNSNSVGYYHNNSLFNKSQIGFYTGFSASLFSNKNTSALIGPYIYYGTTKIAEQGLYKNQHFTFIGFRSQILFKK